ncbi:MAG: ABC transporter permease [Candidatus Heimdallarchaeota archaeon]|nr:ABC transporter permease [Candidatus Heimdallarchaeota archaeon]
MGYFRVVKAQVIRWTRTEFFRPFVLFWNLILPFTWGLQFYFLYLPFEFDTINLQLLNASNLEVDLLGFTLTGQFCWVLFINASLFGGVFFMRERWEGTLEPLFLSPGSRVGVITGTALAATVNFLWFSLGLVISIIILQVQFKIGSLLAVFFSLLVSFLVLLTMGMFFEAFFIASRLGNMWATAIQEPLQFLSGLVFPVQYLPRIFKAISIAIPLTYIFLILRGTLLGALTLMDIYLELSILLLSSICLFFLSSKFIVLVERHVKHKANLTLF